MINGRQEGAGLLREARPTQVNEEAIKAFEDHKVKVVTLERRRLPGVARRRQEELLRQIRQGRAERPEADRRGARGEIAASEPAGGCLPAGRPSRAIEPHAFGPSEQTGKDKSMDSLHSGCDVLVARRRRDCGLADRACGARDLRHGGRALHPQSDHDLADRRRHLLHRRRDLHRQRLRADDARPRQCRHPAAASRRRGRAIWLALSTSFWRSASASSCSCSARPIWYEAYSKNWHSNTVWRARLWIPYLSMPIGLGLLVLQYVAELMCLVTGRAPPFGIQDQARTPRMSRARRREKRWETRHEPDHRKARSSSSSRC